MLRTLLLFSIPQFCYTSLPTSPQHTSLYCHLPLCLLEQNSEVLCKPILDVTHFFTSTEWSLLSSQKNRTLIPPHCSLNVPLLTPPLLLYFTLTLTDAWCDLYLFSEFCFRPEVMITVLSTPFLNLALHHHVQMPKGPFREKRKEIN